MDDSDWENTKKKGRGISSDSLDIETYRCRDIPVPSLKCNGVPGRHGRMQLFRRAFTSRICGRRLFHPSLYIPGTVFTILLPFLQLPLPLRNGRPTLGDLPLSGEEPSSHPLEPKKKSFFIFAGEWSFDIQRNKFPAPSRPPSNAHLNRPPFPLPERSSPLSYPQGSTLAMGRDDGMSGRGFQLFLHEAWSTATTVQGPIFPTHNLQFHILFPSRVRQLVDGGG